MEVQVSQLISGCVLTKDVIGKTNYPIINKNTVLKEEHILILEKFLVEKVEVSSTLADGEKFNVKSVANQSTSKQQTKVNTNQKLSFHECYEHAIVKHKEHFSRWQSNIPINILEVSQFLLPLIESSIDIEIEVYKLHQSATKADYFYHHNISVTILSSILAKKMGFKKSEVIQIGFAGFLSNIGMAKMDPHMITKEQTSTNTEQENIRKHPIYSYSLIQSRQILTEATKLAVLQHHERLDGSGYPLGLKDNKIHQYARIIAVCDIYHAMTSDRYHQKSQSPFKVMNELKKQQFTKLDSLVVQTFMQSFMNLSIGEKVILSNTQVGKITFIDKENLMSPLILLEENGNIISLAEKNLSIIDFI